MYNIEFINGDCYRVIDNSDCGAPDVYEPEYLGPWKSEEQQMNENPWLTTDFPF